MFDSRLFTSRQAKRNYASLLLSNVAIRRGAWLLLIGLLVTSTWLWHKSAAQDGDGRSIQLNGFVQQANLIATNGEGSDQLGKAVALNGDTVIVGAPGDNVGNQTNQGSAYVFRRTSGVWSQETQLLAPDGLGGDSFGQAVAIEGDVAVVGAPFDDKAAGFNPGSAYVFRRTGTTWAFEQKLVPTNPQENDRFGQSVAISGETILLGASLKDMGANADQGAAYVFKRDGANWAQQAQLLAADGAVNDNFGAAVALLGETALVGAPGRAANRGAAYVYTRSGTTWSFQQQLSSNTLAPNDGFGSALALSGETALIGVPQGLASDQGTAFVFTRSGTTWSEQAQLSANDGMGNDGFGTAVALTGDTALVGAPLDDLGVNDANPDQGSAYVFARAGTNWTQQEKLSIIGGAPDDQAGIAVAANAQSVVLGVWLRDVNQALDQGAAYIFDVTCPNLLVSPGSLPPGTPNVAYSTMLSASGGAAPYTFTLNSGTLPSGFTLDSTGLLAGTTTQAGNFSFTVKATDNNGCFNTRSFTLPVGACPTITFNPLVLAPAPVNVQYNQPLIAQGGTGPYHFTRTSGTLPPGIDLSGGGVLFGTPTTQGSFTFTIEATDFNNCSGTRTYTLAITCQSIVLSPETLPSGSLGQSYSQQFSASGGTPGYTFTQNGGNLPTGLSLTTAGLLSGTPTELGTFNFAVKVTDAGGCMTTRTYSVPVCTTITVNPATLPAGRPNQPYAPVTFTATGGNGPYTFVLNGALPTGMSFTTDTLSGTPTQTGLFPLTLTVTSAEGCARVLNYTLAINVRAVKADFDGDARTDLSVWRGAATNWLILNSSNGALTTTSWGTSNPPFNDVIVPGDYDGDGKIDHAVFRRANGTWYIRRSSDGTIQTTLWGLGTDTPVPGDYDGDGKTDIAVWRGSEGTWYIIRSVNGSIQTTNWGTANAPFNDVPVPADYDGDGHTDLAVFRRANGTWYILRSSNGTVQTTPWGLGTDVPVPGDYDGDGKFDLAVWRGTESNWYILRSSNGTTQVTAWGSSNVPFNDVPVPGDYDGDGKYDIAVWRPANGTWYVIRSSNGSILIQVHGQNGDTPVPSMGIR